MACCFHMGQGMNFETLKGSIEYRKNFKFMCGNYIMLTISKGCGNMVDEQMRSGAVFEDRVDSGVLGRLSYDQHNTR